MKKTFISTILEHINMQSTTVDPRSEGEKLYCTPEVICSTGIAAGICQKVKEYMADIEDHLYGES